MPQDPPPPSKKKFLDLLMKCISSQPIFSLYFLPTCTCICTYYLLLPGSPYLTSLSSEFKTCSRMHQLEVFISSDVRTPGKVKTWPRPWTAADVKVPLDCEVDDIRILREDATISDTTLGAAINMIKKKEGFHSSCFLYYAFVFSKALIIAV